MRATTGERRRSGSEARSAAGPPAGAPAWIDLPGGARDALRDVCHRRHLPADTLGCWLLRYNGPRVAVLGDGVFLACHLALARRQELFVGYPLRMLVRADLVLTTHGGGGAAPLRTLLPALRAAGAWEAPLVGSMLLREVSASYGRILDDLLNRAAPVLSKPKRTLLACGPLRHCLPPFMRRVREQRSLLMLLRGSGGRFFAGGDHFIDELTARLVAVEIGATALADLCAQGRRARKVWELHLASGN